MAELLERSTSLALGPGLLRWVRYHNGFTRPRNPSDCKRIIGTIVTLERAAEIAYPLQFTDDGQSFVDLDVEPKRRPSR